ncbi:hypothetical protein MF271_18685 (plasmid) [Deinococcus sp. KNUC1210]|uniref:hypothetical protein n=1 Tax=Deinococcus sp. KNUC1210 TaxID=2917691 RepID=UPI001EF0707A|nr:hypothetical protein [Deinococcus sp. KNUC1210]ULH17156.1 hypothetical protein MF271_18685 [Deinococcus sp. KNUC1210]
MKLHVLGGLSFSGPEAQTLAIQLNAWVCAVLAVSSGRMDRERLAELLWPGVGPAAARSALRQRLHRLKQTPLLGSLHLGEQNAGLDRGFGCGGVPGRLRRWRQ